MYNLYTFYLYTYIFFVSSELLDITAIIYKQFILNYKHYIIYAYIVNYNTYFKLT